MGDDLDQSLFALLGVGMGLNESADRKVNRLPSVLVDQGVGCLLNAVVAEPINRINCRSVRLGRLFAARDTDQFVVAVNRRDQVLLKRGHQAPCHVVR
jgi:hypothetical protein